MKLAAAVLTTVLLHANVVDVRDGSIARVRAGHRATTFAIVT